MEQQKSWKVVYCPLHREVHKKWLTDKEYEDLDWVMIQHKDGNCSVYKSVQAPTDEGYII